jgi:hypothetical protein
MMMTGNNSGAILLTLSGKRKAGVENGKDPFTPMTAALRLALKQTVAVSSTNEGEPCERFPSRAAGCRAASKTTPLTPRGSDPVVPEGGFLDGR